MKVLFVGEGRNELGRPDWPARLRPATGVVPTLSRKVCANIAQDSLAIQWREVAVLNRRKRGNVLAARVQAAIVLALQHGCKGTVCLHDQDREPERLEQMQQGVPPDQTANHPVVCSLAVESIEAWTLGAPEAIATVLGPNVVEGQAYKVNDVESFHQNSDKAEKRPKDLLDQIARAAKREDSTDLRVKIAEHTDIDSLERNCPKGFKPFAQKLRAALGP
jgi:hypothetical protein